METAQWLLNTPDNSVLAELALTIEQIRELRNFARPFHTLCRLALMRAARP